MDFEIVSDISEIETIATGAGIRDRARLQKYYGRGKWRKLKGVAQIQLTNGIIRLAEIHWYESRDREKEFKLKLPFRLITRLVNMQETQFKSSHFAVCLNNEGYEVSLEKGKLYSMLPDEEAHQQGLIRIIDESGEEYAFALNRFYPMELPTQVKEILVAPIKQLINKPSR